MALRPILILPDTKLRQVSDPVAKVTSELRQLVDDMFDTMYEAPGIGLAAIQVGVPQRVVTIDAPGIGLAAIQVGVPQRVVTIDVAKQDEPKEPMALINPEILWTSDETSSYEEGCLSIPDYYELVERPAKVRVRFLDRDGGQKELEAEGLLATCLQHEIDHLDGRLFIDHISKLKRDRVIKKFQKQARLDRG